MVQLSVPYHSQWSDSSSINITDCGPTCLAMILNYFGIDATSDSLYKAHLPRKRPHDFTTFAELRNIAREYNITLNRSKFNHRDEALANLRQAVADGWPVLTLVKYRPWKQATGNDFDFGHFVVVTGFEGNQFFFHDPLFADWRSNPPRGAHFTMDNDLFAAGWGGFPAAENPNWACAIARGPRVPTPVDTTRVPAEVPPLTPATPTTPVPSPTARTATAPAAHDLTPEQQRRIRALAAYRWTEPPAWDDPAAVDLWVTHLGEFGQEVTRHTVAAGDTMSALASRYYNEQHRWPAIKAFNNMQREGLWLGEILEIPLTGESGGHDSDALPHDTLGGPGTLSADGDAVNPDMEALSYNSLGANSIGIGFEED